MLTLSQPSGSAPGAAVQLFEKYQFPDKSMICLIYSQPFCLNLVKNLIFSVGSHSVFDTAKARRSIVQRAQHLDYTANCFSRQDKTDAANAFSVDFTNSGPISRTIFHIVFLIFSCYDIDTERVIPDVQVKNQTTEREVANDVRYQEFKEMTLDR